MINSTNRPEYNAPSPPGDSARLAVMTSAGAGSRASAANLSTALAKRGKHVCLITTDSLSHNKPALSGQDRGSPLEDLLAGRKVLAEILFDGSAGTQILPAGNTFSNFFNLDEVQKKLLVDLLAHLEAAFDYLIVEAAAEADKGSLELYQAAPLILLTITPEADSLTKAFSLLRALKRKYTDQPIHVIVDMAGSLPNAHDAYKKLQHAASKYLQMDPHYLGYSPSPQPLQGLAEPARCTADSPPPDPHAAHYLGAITDRFCAITEMIVPMTCLSHHFSELCSAQRRAEESIQSAASAAEIKTAKIAETQAQSTHHNPGGWHERLSDRIALYDAVHYAAMLAERESNREKPGISAADAEAAGFASPVNGDKNTIE